jgi:hypothetical protein
MLQAIFLYSDIVVYLHGASNIVVYLHGSTTEEHWLLILFIFYHFFILQAWLDDV